MSGLFNFWAASVTVSPNEIGIPRIDLNNSALANALSAVFMLLGGMAVLFMLVGAVRYVTSGGDPKNIKSAKDTILYALVGLVIAASAFTIVQFTLGKLGGSI
jgi:hypothetical protein